MPALPPFTILIVDDNANNRFTLSTLLSRLKDCVIIEAESGQDALVRLFEQQVHLILLDVQMPGMDGYEIARHLAMIKRTRDIPVIFVTAVYKSDEFVRRGYAVGAVDYLTKPIDDNLLLNRVNSYRKLRERERRLAQALLESEAANRTKSIFLANMSHELRTPLNAIIGFAQILERDKRIPEDQLENLHTIVNSGRCLMSLINDVLEISRIEEENSNYSQDTYSRHELLDATVKSLSTQSYEAISTNFNQVNLLKSIPAELRTALCAAVKSLDIEEIISIIEQIRTIDPVVANNLSALTSKFQFEKIIAMCVENHT